MCSINHDLKAIFIHVHKTGGTYLSYMLHKYYGFKNYYLRRPDHDTFCQNKKKTTKYINYENRIHGVLKYYKTSPHLNKKMNMTPQKWNSYYKFCFIRNPYDKIISAWNHINRFKIPFNNYLNLTHTCNDVEYMHMFLPQVRNIINEKGLIDINFIGRFENLEEDFQKVLRNIGIKNIIHDVKKQMNRREHLDFYEYYDQNTLNKVNLLLIEDFKKLDYPMITHIDIFKNTFNKNINNKIENLELNNNQNNEIDTLDIDINNNQNNEIENLDINNNQNNEIKNVESNNNRNDKIENLELNNNQNNEIENLENNLKEENVVNNKENNIKLCCFYSYNEKNQINKYNLLYFLNNAILDEMDYYIIISGKSNIQIPYKKNIKILKRDDKGFDFGAYCYAIEKISIESIKYDYYFFINSSKTFAFIKNNNKQWYEYYIELFNKNVKLVSSSIHILNKNFSMKYNLNNIYRKKYPFYYIQTIFFCMNNEYFSFLNNINFFNENEVMNKDIEYIISYKDIGLSQIALNNNWNINCINEKFKNIDYINIQ
jgi:hypothetical protein